MGIWGANLGFLPPNIDKEELRQDGFTCLQLLFYKILKKFKKRLVISEK